MGTMQNRDKVQRQEVLERREIGASAGLHVRRVEDDRVLRISSFGFRSDFGLLFHYFAAVPGLASGRKQRGRISDLCLARPLFTTLCTGRSRWL